MRKMFKQALCIVSVLVLMCVSFFLPASADTTYPALTTSNVSDVLLANYKNILNKYWGTSDLACIVAWTQNSNNNRIAYRIEVFDKKYIGTTVSYNGLYYGHIGNNGCDTTEDIVNGYWNNLNLDFSNPFYSSPLYKSLTGQSSIQFHIVYSNIKIDGVTDIVDPDPNAIPAPFTVTYTPELSLNMQNKIYYPSKGGANADENGLVAAENNNINLDINLTSNFLKTFNEKDLGKAYGSGTYAVLCCLSKNLLNAGDDLQRFFDEDVVLYAMNHDGNYYKGQDDEQVNADGSSSDDLNSNGTVDSFEPYLTLYQGRTPIYTIPRDGKLSVTFDLTSIDYETHGLTDDSQLYVNVIGVFVKNNGQVTPQNGEKTEDTTSSTWLGSYAYQEDFTNLKTCEKIDDFVKSVDEETGKPETFKAYRVYSVISDPFSYEKFPDYVPKVYKDKDGNTYNPSTSKLKDLCNIPPSKVTDVDLAKGSDGVVKDGSYMQPDDYNKYLEKKKINANFGSVDFTDIKSIFSTTGTYWDFLTAALSCLPSWFYAVFSAWFVLFLAIALIKLVIPT